jgi:hypothetical protein
MSCGSPEVQAYVSTGCFLPAWFPSQSWFYGPQVRSYDKWSDEKQQYFAM